MTASLLSSDQIERARKTDIRAVAERVGAKLKRISSTEWAGPCPACGGVDRFSVNIKKGIFNCRGANGGDTIAMAQHALGLDFVEAVAFLGERGEERREVVYTAPPAPVISCATTTADALR